MAPRVSSDLLLVGSLPADSTETALRAGGEFFSDLVFARIFPLAAPPLVFGGIGFALFGTSILPRFLARGAVVIAGLFLVVASWRCSALPG